MVIPMSVRIPLQNSKKNSAVGNRYKYYLLSYYDFKLF